MLCYSSLQTRGLSATSWGKVIFMGAMHKIIHYWVVFLSFSKRKVRRFPLTLSCLRHLRAGRTFSHLPLQGIGLIHALLAAQNDLGKKVSGPCTSACIIAARDMRVNAHVHKQSVARIHELIHAFGQITCKIYTRFWQTIRVCRREFDRFNALIHAITEK